MIERRIFLLLAALAAFAPLAIDLYLPSLGSLAQDLNTTTAMAQRTVTVFLVGFAGGMLVYGPLSDRFGRRRVILAGTALFIGASLGCAMASSIEALLVWRFVQAIGGGAAAVVSRAVVRDLYAEHEAARLMAMIGMVTSIAPMVAPLAGAALLHLGGWRLEFMALTLFGVVCLAGTLKVLPETLSQQRTQHSLGLAFQGYAHVLAQPQARRLILTGGSHYAAMFAYITATPYVYMQWLGVSEQGYGVLFGANIVSLMGFGWYSSRRVMALGAAKLAQQGSRWAVLGGLLVLAAAWPAQASDWTLPLMVLGFLLAVGSLGLVAPNTLAQLLAAHPNNAGAAAALYGCAQFGLGGLASGLVSAMHDGTARPLGVLVLAFLVLAWSLGTAKTAPGVQQE